MSDRTTPVDARAIIASIRDRLDGAPLVLMLDVDGTLAPIAPTPTAARVPAETRRVVEQLAAEPDVVVAMVSGRSADDTWRLAGVPGAIVIGNHGFERRDRDGTTSPDPRALGFDLAIADAARELEREFADVRGAIVENKRWTLSVHYRQVDPGEAAALITAAKGIADRLKLQVFSGKKIVELRPPLDVTKGTACAALLEAHGVREGNGSAFYAGDDRTDEDAFRAIRAVEPSAVTIRVADQDVVETAAEFIIDSPDSLRDVLEWIAARRMAARSVRR